MAHIAQLPPHVADLIAAGEVVERPASVVKELMENALDAHAGAITVEIRNGGMTLIRVTDDGAGIPPEELPTAFLRHATSKIRTEQDLEAIGTLGFRGEALAAISAVSQVEVMTCQEGQELGAALKLEGGVPGRTERIGCPKGTTMVVRDLFFNTPARLKFMKRDAAEGAAVFAVVQRIALSHPGVRVKFLRDGKNELITPGDGKLQNAMYAVLGRSIALGFTPVAGSGEDVTVEGYCSLPVCCRTTRANQFFFVNGRLVRSRLMTAALEEAYQNRKMVGKFPGCVLFLEVRPTAVDVNVHPAKTEVKFGSERKIFDAVYYAVMGALDGESGHPSALGEKPPAPAPEARPRPVFAAPPQERSTAVLRDSGRPAPAPYRAPEAPPVKAGPAVDLRPKPAPPAEERRQPPPSPAPAPVRPEAPRPAAAPQQELPPLLAESERPWRVAGEVFNTYIIVEQGDTMLLIDKHAAHERMNFDRMKAEGYTPMVQQLLTPVVFTPPAEEGEALLEHSETLSAFGFAVEAFGDGALLVRQAPFDVDAADVEGALCQLGAKLVEGGRPDPEAARDALLHTMACKAAIKGGQKNGEAELYRVARAVMSGEVKYCPHGRPVATEVTRGQLEKRFNRT